MTFKIVLTCLFAVAAFTTLDSIDRPRSPTTGGSALLTLIIDAVLIYGVWKWL